MNETKRILPKGARARAKAVLAALEELYPAKAQHLNAASPWQLLVATVLAAQCTDARVNLVTPELFRRWPDAAALTGASQAELETVIHSTGFYRVKAKNLLAAAALVTHEHNNTVPGSLEALIRLPGVARKTANCVLSSAFGKNEGLAVDTHVKRIAFRLGLSAHADPEQVEQDLMLLFPRASWGMVNNRMVSFGRDVCVARKPRCSQCPLDALCPANGVVPA